MPYTPDTWANNDPTKPLNATRLTKLAGQYPQVMADLPAKITDSGDPIGEALASTIGSVVDTGLSAANVAERTVSNAVGEWWIHPLVTSLSSPAPRRVFGAIASDGKILACEITPRGTRRYVVGQAIVDDHCVPALYAETGHRSVIAWTNHNLTGPAGEADNLVHLRISDKYGSLGSFATAPAVTIEMASGASYTQIHRITHLSTSTLDYFWMFVRVGYNGWHIARFTVDQVSGNVRHIGNVDLLSGNGNQEYISTVDAFNASGNQVIRIASGFNPAAAIHTVHYFEIDVVTGAVTNPAQPGMSTRNISGTGLPINVTAVTATLPEVSAGNSRRLFYCRPGPFARGIAYAEWATANPDAATYKVANITINNTSADAYDGLIAGDGYAQSASLSSKASQWAAGYQYTVCMQMPTLGTEVNLGRLGGATTPTMEMRILADGKIYTQVRGNDFSVNNTSSTTPFSTLMGQKLWVRLTYDIALKKVRRYTSTDGTTFTQIGTNGLDIAGTTTSAYQLATTGMVFDTDALNVFSAKLESFSNGATTGTTIFNVAFDSAWPDRTSSYTDPQGNYWEVMAPAIIGTTTPPTDPITVTVTDIGTSGPRVGYTDTSNYIAGLSFPNPCYDDTIVRARSAASVEYLDVLRRQGASYVAENVLTQPSALGRIIRPYVPVNGGVDGLTHTNMTAYAPDSFNVYAGGVLSSRAV